MLNYNRQRFCCFLLLINLRLATSPKSQYRLGSTCLESSLAERHLEVLVASKLNTSQQKSAACLCGNISNISKWDPGLHSQRHYLQRSHPTIPCLTCHIWSAVSTYAPHNSKTMWMDWRGYKGWLQR